MLIVEPSVFHKRGEGGLEGFCCASNEICRYRIIRDDKQKGISDDRISTFQRAKSEELAWK